MFLEILLQCLFSTNTTSTCFHHASDLCGLRSQCECVWCAVGSTEHQYKLGKWRGVETGLVLLESLSSSPTSSHYLKYEVRHILLRQPVECTADILERSARQAADNLKLGSVEINFPGLLRPYQSLGNIFLRRAALTRQPTTKSRVQMAHDVQIIVTYSFSWNAGLSRSYVL